MRQVADWARRRWEQFRWDVWDDPSVGPVASVLLTVLAALIIWLTWTYAPGSVERAGQALSQTKAAGEGVINPFWGKVTVGLMTAATLTAGFEPILGRHVAQWWRRAGRVWWMNVWRPLRFIRFVPIVALIVPAKLASLLWSFLDYLLARPIASLGGAAWRGWIRRYLHFVAIMLFAIGSTVAVETIGLNPNIALAAVVAGLVVILAIVRRWSWIESDRDTFLIERGERQHGRGMLRIGFKEDLRDEALFALACLFFLIPLGLDIVQQTSSANGVPAFAFNTVEPMPRDFLGRLSSWLGYFGAELAKTVPFVDWSEVFHVANGSPIEARTPLGSQLAFVLRAGLDLLFLAAVLQAVQIATRLREQESAFRNNRLPILEPFSERAVLARAAEQIDDDLDLRTSAQPALLNFPRYDSTRLKELIDGTAENKDINVRMVAAALLQKDYEASPDDNSDTPRFWTSRAQNETSSEFRRFILDVASGLNPDESRKSIDDARRGRMLRLAEDDRIDAHTRATAIRTIGQVADGSPEADALSLCLARDENVLVRATAGLALAKGKVLEALPLITALAEHLEDGAVLPAQITAFALAHYPLFDLDSCARLREALRTHARFAAQIQRVPFEIAVPDGNLARNANNVLVAIRPGCGPFPASFEMGSPPNADLPPEPARRESPLHKVAMTRHFSVGRYPVTNEEYFAFCEATKTSWSDPTPDRGSRLPAGYVPWQNAAAFCDWLNSITGNKYRLVAENEWEYACRAGSSTKYSWGNDWDPSKANAGTGRATEVGSFPSNDWTIFDMHGNVFEWCADPWHTNYKGARSEQGPWVEGGDFSARVLRGGSFSNQPLSIRCADRSYYEPTFANFNRGFRIGMTLS